jgi:hypothetical protein
MSPPEIWGPPVWTLIHTLSEKLNENAYNQISPQLYNYILAICKFLPCPECSQHATKSLAKVPYSNLKNKMDFKNNFYLFHNSVNSRKQKQLFRYSDLNRYKQYNVINVVNNFITSYHTRGNMNLLNDSFQRKLIIQKFKSWFTSCVRAFIPPLNVPPPLPNMDTLENQADVSGNDV